MYLSKVSKTQNLNFIGVAGLKNSFDIVVIAIGTSPAEQIEGIDFLKRFHNTLLEIQNKDFHLMIRSTVEINTTKIISSYLRTLFPNVTISFCPERSIEGNAINDCLFLPQIVSGVDERSLNLALEFFESISIKTSICLDTSEAEFCKLIGNVWRDSTFAIANELSQIATEYKIDIFRAIEVSNKGYSRSFIPVPGPVAGPCLTKDTNILTRRLHGNPEHAVKSLIINARKTNALIPNKIIKFVQNNFEVNKTRILILGTAFKGHPPTKDTRNSIGIELYENLSQDYKASIIDPEINGLSHDSDYNEISKLVSEHDVIILTTNHKYFNNGDFIKVYNNFSNVNKVLVDLWPKEREWHSDQVESKSIKYADWHSLLDE